MLGNVARLWPAVCVGPRGVSPEWRTDIRLVEGLKFRFAALDRGASSPVASVTIVLHNLPIVESRLGGLMRRLRARRPSPSASRMRTVAVLNDQEG